MCLTNRVNFKISFSKIYKYMRLITGVYSSTDKFWKCKVAITTTEVSLHSSYNAVSLSPDLS